MTMFLDADYDETDAPDSPDLSEYDRYHCTWLQCVDGNGFATSGPRDDAAGLRFPYEIVLASALEALRELELSRWACLVLASRGRASMLTPYRADALLNALELEAVHEADDETSARIAELEHQIRHVHPLAAAVIHLALRHLASTRPNEASRWGDGLYSLLGDEADRGAMYDDGMRFEW